MFEPGQKVVCVDGNFPLGINDIFNALPAEGKTYTVRDIVPGSGFGGRESDPQVAVYLVELVNMPNRHGIEPGFKTDRFRPLEEISQEEVVAAHEPTQLN